MVSIWGCWDIKKERRTEPFGSHGFRSQMFGRFIFQLQVLKVGVPEAGDNPSFLGRSSGSVRSLGIAGCHARGWVYGETLSQPFLPALMCLLMWRSYSANFHFFFGVNCTISSCRLGVSLGGGEFRLFLCHHVELLFRAYI